MWRLPTTSCCQRSRPRATELCCAEQRARAVVNATDSTVDVSLGIDLGTTNSVAAVVRGDGKPEVVPVVSAAGDWRLPSVMAVTADAEVLVGKKAVQQAARNAANTFHSTKRIIGQRIDDLPRQALELPYTVSEDEEGWARLECRQAPGGALYPEEVAAQVLSTLKAAAEVYADAGFECAVITVPAYFDKEQCAATVAAGQIAGFESVKLIREPVAAALAYGLDLQTDQTVLVFDLGGGTLDVSILEVLATGGDMSLGGDDWDAAIVKHIVRTELAHSGVPTKTPRMRTQLTAMARAAKEQLSAAETVALRLPVGGPSGAGVAFTLQRKQLDGIAQALYRRCRLPVEQACWQAGVERSEVREALDAAAAEAAVGDHPPSAVIRPKRRDPISEVLLVGGATRMPGVRKCVENMTGLTARVGLVDPDAAVALGAALHAGVLSGHKQGAMMLDVWQAALARALADDAMSELPRLGGEGKEGNGGPGEGGEGPSQNEMDSDDESDWELPYALQGNAGVRDTLDGTAHGPEWLSIAEA